MHGKMGLLTIHLAGPLKDFWLEQKALSYKDLYKQKSEYTIPERTQEGFRVQGKAYLGM